MKLNNDNKYYTCIGISKINYMCDVLMYLETLPIKVSYRKVLKCYLVVQLYPK